MHEHLKKSEAYISMRVLFENSDPPMMIPPEEFKWYFLAGIWAMIPANVDSYLGVDSVAFISKYSQGT